MNLNRILYSMCYDMLEQKHTAYKTENGLAIACSETPLWIWLAQNTDARLFFHEFLRQNENPLTGIVAEKEIALACAEIYGKDFSQKGLVSYFLPPEATLPGVAIPGELRLSGAPEMPLIFEWIHAFYSETLHAEMPGGGDSSPGLSSARLFIWHDSQPVAMGLLTGEGETCRINLIYVSPEFRGKGYGRAVVCALAKKARKSEQLPVLYTDSENAAANGLYTALGFREAGRLLEVTFN